MNATEKRLRKRITVLERRLTVTREDARSIVGEGFHVMLRKGIDGHGSGEMHRWLGKD
jgi:hypothetical protein